MKTRLLIECSPRAGRSASRRCAAELVRRLSCRESGLRLMQRDLAAEPPSPVDHAFTEAMHVPAARRNAEERRALRESEQLISELETADIVVIATPMHNFTVPALLKSWIDQVVRVGRTFDTTPDGKIGTLADRPTFILVSSGGFVTGERGRQPDFLTPYMRAVLATIGIRTTHFGYLEGTGRNSDWFARAQGWMDTHVLPCPQVVDDATEPSSPSDHWLSDPI